MRLNLEQAESRKTERSNSNFKYINEFYLRNEG